MALMEYERLSTVTEKQIIHARALDYVRWLGLTYENGGRGMQAAEMYELRYPRSVNIELVHKAAVAAMTTTDATAAGPLAAANPLEDAFLSMLRPRTLLGRIPGLRQVPFNITVPQQTAAGVYGWVGQGAPMVVTKGDFATLSLGVAKAGGIVIVTEELATLSRPGADVVLRDELIRGIAQFLDTQFVDPAVAAVANVSPASITNGTTAIAASGTSAAALLTDVKALIAAFVAANSDVEAVVLLMTPSHAVALAIATNSQTLTMRGGTIFGVDVITSANVGARIIILDAQGILYADNGRMDISASNSALVQMNTVPDDPTLASTVQISLFQKNLVGFRGVRWVNWLRSATSSVKYISGALYA
jgi:HK97 family phage major capsid protein